MFDSRLEHSARSEEVVWRNGDVIVDDNESDGSDRSAVFAQKLRTGLDGLGLGREGDCLSTSRGGRRTPTGTFLEENP